MEKKPIAIIFNDVHLKTGNESDVLDATKYMIEVANEKGIKNLIFAGDLFDSRSFQRLKVLKTFESMLSKFYFNGIKVWCIPGNHDKSIYKEKESFLDAFRWFPNFELFDDVAHVSIEGVKVTLIPFFSDDELIPRLKESEGSDVLISHFEMQGSSHLGQVSQKTTINKKLLSKWKKVYLGHYHNHHEITKDIVHLPSFIQSNFGEDNNKGFSILYDDLTYSITKGRFKEFRKIQIDADSINTSELKKLIKTHENSSSTIRFEFTGTEAKLKALDRSLFKDTKIDVKLKYDLKFNFDDSSLPQPTIIEKYNKSDIKKIFKAFCRDKDLDFEEGDRMLEEFLKQQ